VALQPVHDEPDEVCFSRPAVPKSDGFLTTSSAPHAGHATVELRENSSFSKS
jgi:hypothetical protein